MSCMAFLAVLTNVGDSIESADSITYWRKL